MANIAFVVTMSDGTKMTKTAAVSDTEVARLVAWGVATFPTQMDASGNPIPKTTPWVVGRWIEAIVAETFWKIRGFEQANAAKVAQDAIQPINVSIT